MQKKQKIILAIFSSLCFVGALFSIVLTLKNGKVLSITGEKENLLKTQEVKRSPFSGMPCENPDGRAFSVVLAQYAETMPLSGISFADIVVEGPVANPDGIARLLAIYQCQNPLEIGSIRSVRPYMVDLALSFDTIFASWGGCNAGVQRIKDLGLDWLDARVLISSGVFFRKRNVLAPHNGFTSLDRLKAAAKNSKMRETNQFEGYQFLKEEEVILGKNDQKIEIYYYNPVKYIYDSKTGNYLRFWNGEKMKDRNTLKQVWTKNVVIMKTKMGILSSGVVDVKIIDTGEATIYQAGKEIKGMWQKENSRARLVFFDKEGKEIKFVPGPVWIELVGNW